MLYFTLEEHRTGNITKGMTKPLHVQELFIPSSVGQSVNFKLELIGLGPCQCAFSVLVSVTLNGLIRKNILNQLCL